ncbi:helix-turn-helix domain-containing protein [Halalkalibaculum sp. DA3122]|uniref:helix-turn-helix domain-containing protein n=1 Tax=Halalkalibaculum sp. DA3122 TaxID=3373607 RepID=UPI003754D74F
MNVFIPNKEELEEAIYEAVQQVLREEMPEIIRKATRRKWLTTEEVMEMLQCSRRHIQYLRDSNQLSYSQKGRTIRYNIDDIEAFLNEGKVE